MLVSGRKRSLRVVCSFNTKRTPGAVLEREGRKPRTEGASAGPSAQSNQPGSQGAGGWLAGAPASQWFPTLAAR